MADPRLAPEAAPRPKSLPITSPTLADWMRSFLDARERERMRDIVNDRRRSRTHIEADVIGGVRLDAVDAAHLRGWLGRMMGKGGTSRGRPTARLNARTVRNVVTLLRVALARAVESGWIAQNPARDLDVPRSSFARVDDAWTVLEIGEQRALVKAARIEGLFFSVLVRVALGAGLRRGELLALRWTDCHLETEAPFLWVHHGAHLRPTKGGKPRKVPLFGVALAALDEWNVTTDGAQQGPERLVFPGSRGERTKIPRTAFARALARAGITRTVRWHDLRHTCGTSLLEGTWGRQWTVEEVREMLGHTTATTTERYLHARGTALFQAASEMRQRDLFETLAREDLRVGSAHGQASTERNQGAGHGIRIRVSED